MAEAGRLAYTDKLGANSRQLEAIKAENQRQRDYFGAGVKLKLAGANGPGVDELAGTPGWAPPGLGGIEVPQKKEETAEDKLKAQFVKPQYDKKGNLLPGTGRWYQPGENYEEPGDTGGAAAQNGGPGTVSHEDFAFAQNLVNAAGSDAEAKKTLQMYRKTNPDLYKLLIEEIKGQAAAQ